MQYLLLILTGLTCLGCGSIRQIPNTYEVPSRTTDPLVSVTVGKEKTGPRILIGFGVGAVLGAVVGAVAVQEMNEENFASNDDSRTDPLLGAAVGSVVGAGVGALVAAVTARRKRRHPPWIPNQISREMSLYREASGNRAIQGAKSQFVHPRITAHFP